MKLIKDLGCVFAVPTSKKRSRHGIYECPSCKKHVRKKTGDVKKYPLSQCKSCAMRDNNTTHGLSGHPLYKIWVGIKTRCYNEKRAGYKDYGGRGIVMYSSWREEFEKFYEWSLKNGWHKLLTIDRKNNNGNYTPDNCRFVNKSMQAINRRSPRNKSGYIGVSFDAEAQKYRSEITVNKKAKNIGRFKYSIDAAEARDFHIMANNLPHKLNLTYQNTIYR